MALLYRRLCSRPTARPLFAARRIGRSMNMTSATPMEPLWSTGIEEGHKEEARKLLRDGRWELSATRMGLERKFEFKSFKTTMVFINQVADQCKVARHHPEWANVYNKVVIRWTTHNPLGLSQKDIEMAKFCDERGAELGDVDTGKVERAPAEKTGVNVLDSLLGQGSAGVWTMRGKVEEIGDSN